MSDTEMTDLELARAEADRTQDVMFNLCMALGDNPSPAATRKHEAAVDAFAWARMDFDREWAKVYKPCPSRLSVSGVLRDLPEETKEERNDFWGSFRARVAAEEAKVGEKRKA